MVHVPWSAGDAQTSPISKLSVELLSAVFREAFIWNSTKTSNTISHVSRAWRAIALDDPLLWSAIHLTVNKPSDFTQLCLARSKQSDLQVLYTIDHESELPDEAVPPFDPAVLHLHRCRHLELNFVQRSSAFAVLEALKHASAPKLASFKVAVGGNPEDRAESDHPGDIFTGGAPLLTFVALDNVSILQCHVPLASVKTLSLKGCGSHSEQYSTLYPSEFVGILREAAPTLQYLTLDSIEVFSDNDKPWSVVELPALTALCFGNIEKERRQECEEYPKKFWKFVKMPKLEDLSLYSLNRSQLQAAWSEAPEVKALSLRSLSQLRELDKGPHAIFMDIESLALDYTVLSEVLTSIVYPKKRHIYLLEDSWLSPPPFWPMMKSLTFDDCYEDDEAHLIRRFIRGRKAIGLPIKRVTFLGHKLPRSVLECARKHVGTVTLAESLSIFEQDEEENESENEEGGRWGFWKGTLPNKYRN
ncbi:hypothetical protein HWV62_9657 [Athelia sp. TMB]|nr:hypothetical protein HWV62_9657 [Athelia sp. TMB]